MDELTTEIVTFIVNELKDTQLGKSFDITQSKAKINELFADITFKLDQKSKLKVMSFMKNNTLFRQCIIPNIAKICADIRINIDDTPYFIDVIYGVYSSINEFVQDNPTVNISSNDLIELSGLLLKLTLVIIVQDANQLNLGISIINNTIKLVKLTVQSKKISCKLCCCVK